MQKEGEHPEPRLVVMVVVVVVVVLRLKRVSGKDFAALTLARLSLVLYD